MTVQICPSCSAHVPAGFKFCGECGAKFAAAPALSAPAPAASAPQAAPSQRDEFRDVTILFADVTGFTTLSERLDPEALHTLMNACFDGLGRIVTAHGGHIDKYIGDSIMALFGAPVAHEDDPVRAGEVALEMQRFVSAFAADYASAAGSDFRIRIGINSGLVLAGSIGTADKRDYSVMGDAVNTASRLEGAARPGSILVSDDFRRRVEGQFAFGGEVRLSLKGKDKPVAAFELLADGGRHARTGARVTPFVGRSAQIDAIVRHRQNPAESRCWIDIRGPLGIGKSRLAEQALSRIAGHETVRAISRPATRMRPFALMRRVLFALYERAGGGSAPPATREAFVSGLGPLLADLDPFINALWYLAAPDALALKAPDPDPLTFRKTVDRGLERLFANLADSAPNVTLLLDAFDQADEETQRFLTQAWNARSVRLPPLVTTTRADGLSRREATLTVDLDPLTDADAGRLFALIADARITGRGPIDPATRQSLLARASGVPLFIVELVRALAEDGAAASDAPALAPPALPSSLLGLMSARLDRLDAIRRDVLSQCAVQGVEFSAAVAKSLWHSRGKPEDMAIVLQDLAARHFIQALDMRGERYAFVQALMQNACYDSMLKRDRRVLHSDVAAALIAIAGGAQAVSAEQLATHYELSEQWHDAARQNLRAAERAAGIYANADALARYARAVRALREHGSEEPGDRHVAYEAHHGAAHVHLRIGSYGNLESAAETMLRYAAGRSERAEAIRMRAQGRLHTGDLMRAGDMLEEARALASDEVPGNAPGVLCHVLYDLADVAFRRGDHEAARRTIAACRTKVPAHCPEILRLDILEGRVAHTQGRFGDAVRLYQRAHAAAADAGSLSEEALTSNYMGNAARDVGRYEDAENYFARALEIWTRVGLTESIAGAHNNLANLAISRGDGVRAKHHYLLALEAFQKISNAAGTALALTNLAILAIEEGRAAAAVDKASQAKALLLTAGHRVLLGLAGVVHGEALIAAGRHGDAEGEFDWVLSEYSETNHPLAIAGARRGHGRAALLRKDAQAALAHLESALALYERLAREQEAGRTELYLAQAFALSGQNVKAQTLREKACTRFERIGAQTDLARARTMAMS